MSYIALLGRILFSAIFVFAGIGHFQQQTIDYAANQGLPMANFLVPLSGVIAIVGGLSIALGLFPRFGGLLIVLFLVPVTLKMHAFWNYHDPQMHQMQMAMFMKNVSMLGAALMIIYFGAGPLSFSRYQPKPTVKVA